MNKHVELVEKWLKDKEAVSLEELRANASDAYEAAYVAPSDAYDTAYNASDAAYDAASYAANAAAYAADTAYYVERYKELTK